tara:strand:+ start:1413 stop:2330 length:918 start_codon:yes stop_codon:yes gene_type:complete
MASFITFNKIAKKVNNKNLLANLSFGVQKNETLFILGEPGSGRSTLFEILMGTVNRDKGDIFIDGMNYDKRIDEIRSIIGYLPQENIFDNQLNILENLYFYGQLKNMDLSLVKKESRRWADVLGFKEHLYMMPNQIPFEFLRKISIARALLSDPKILLLDNPTLGMNFVDKQLFWQVINEFKNDKTILCISQDFQEIEYCADRVVILNNGAIAMNSSLINIDNAINNTYRYQFVFKKIVPNAFLKQAKLESNIKNIISRDKYFEFTTKSKSVFFKTFQAALEYDLIDLKFSYSKLNEIYLKVINR